MAKLYVVCAVLLLDVVYAGGWWRRNSACTGDLSDGPVGADVEVRIGNLPPSTTDETVYLSWWAAIKSETPYKPLENPSQAQVHETFRNSYGQQGSSSFNGGRVPVSEFGEATVRVHAPGVYRSHRGGNARYPHVHFNICGQHGKPKKLVFMNDGVHIKGGCRRWSSNTVSYTVVSARDISANSSLTSQTEVVQTSSQVADQSPAQAQSEAQDWDALEFSSVYECLDGAELFDQFSSGCTSRCPEHAEMVHGQCVRQKICEQGCRLSAKWRLSLDCNDKCWQDAAPVARHSIRLALADHFDITFQEARRVRFRKDAGSPTTHAHLNIVVDSRRLKAELGNSLLASFLANATVASEVLGLTVHGVELEVDAANTGNRVDGERSVNASLTDAALAGEDADEYAEYYVPLEQNAERLAQPSADGGERSVAGIPVPSSIPTVAIVGIAAGIVLVLASLVGCLYIRRRRLLAHKPTTINGEKTVDNDVPASSDKAAV